MKIIRGMRKTPRLKASSVCMGIFDGVHAGHAAIFQKTVLWAKKYRIPSVAVTFDPHPAKVLAPRAAPPLLQTLDERLDAMRSHGLTHCIILSFSKQFSKMSAQVFVKDFLFKKLGARTITIGRDFRFGYQAKGNPQLLKRIAFKRGCELNVVPPVLKRKRRISSSRIRGLIKSGQITKAQALWGRKIMLRGYAVRGRGRGALLGYPTLNLRSAQELLPGPGVYAVTSKQPKGWLNGAMHLGPRPTFGDAKPQIEIHFLAKHNPLLYNKIQAHVVKRIRSIRKFKSPDALKRQIALDLRAVRRALS